MFWQHKSFSSYTKLWGASCCPGDGDSIRTKQWRKIGAKVWTNLASSVKFGSLIRVKEPSREQEEELSMTRNKNGSGSPDFGSPSAGNRTRGNLLLITMESIQLSHRQPWLTSSVSSYLIFARIFVVAICIINSPNHAVSIILIYALITSKHLCQLLRFTETLQTISWRWRFFPIFPDSA